MMRGPVWGGPQRLVSVISSRSVPKDCPTDGGLSANQAPTLQVAACWSVVQGYACCVSATGAMGFYRKSDIKRHYDLGETLGSGNFAIVKRATRKQPSSGREAPSFEASLLGEGCDVAIKIIDKTKVDEILDIRVRRHAQCPCLYG